MKKLLAVSGLLLSMFVLAHAQKTVTSFAGTWEADMTKTKLPEGGRGPKVLGQTLTVTQDAKTITIASDTKTDGTMAVPAISRTYNLDGTESSGELKMMQMSAPAKLKATVMDGGKLQLNLSADIEGPMGAMNITQNDTWELMDGGKTLKVHRNRTTPRGTEETDWYYTKQ